MAITYTGLGSTVTISAQGTTITAGFNTNVAVVGGYDASNGSATAGQSYAITDPSDADDLFGTSSELSRTINAMAANASGTIYAVPVAETTGSTESFSATSTGTLNEIPFDPRIHDEHDISAQDTVDATSMVVNYVDESPPTSPSNANTMNVNPTTGEWAADTSSDYDITYDYGNYTPSIETAVDQPVRFVSVLSESDTHENTLQTELQTLAKNFIFRRGVTGAKPDIATGDISSYSPSTDDWRMIEVAPSRGSRSDNTIRTAGPIAAMLSAQPVNVEGSVTYDSVKGLDDLNKAYLPTEAANFDRVTALTREFVVAEGVTTSSKNAFSDVYKAELIDTVTDALYELISAFKGGGNLQEDQNGLRTDIKLALSSFENDRPPLLVDSTVSVSTGTTETETDVTVGIDPAPIAKQVNLNISVGDIVTFDGASTA